MSALGVERTFAAKSATSVYGKEFLQTDVSPDSDSDALVTQGISLQV